MKEKHEEKQNLKSLQDALKVTRCFAETIFTAAIFNLHVSSERRNLLSWGETQLCIRSHQKKYLLHWMLQLINIDIAGILFAATP